VSAEFTADDENEVPLDTGGRRYRYYLVWITDVGSDGQAGVSELSLLR
jgi:hypothetical protein